MPTETVSSFVQTMQRIITELKSDAHRSEVELKGPEFLEWVKMFLSNGANALAGTGLVIPSVKQEDQRFAVTKTGLMSVVFGEHPKIHTVTAAISQLDGNLTLKALGINVRDFPIHLDELSLTFGNARENGKIQTTQVQATPDKIGSVPVASAIQQVVGGTKIMDVMKQVLTPLAQANGASLSGLEMSITPNKSVKAVLIA